jgi:hypothetical protein
MNWSRAAMETAQLESPDQLMRINPTKKRESICHLKAGLNYHPGYDYTGVVWRVVDGK